MRQFLGLGIEIYLTVFPVEEIDLPGRKILFFVRKREKNPIWYRINVFLSPESYLFEFPFDITVLEVLGNFQVNF